MVQGDGALSDKWLHLDREEKAEFFRTHHQLAGAELRAEIETVVRSTYSERRKQEINKTSDWWDEEDVRKAYKDKPEQLNAILSGKNFTCEVRKVKLYEVPVYKTSEINTKESSHEREISTTTKSFLKAEKEKKAARQIKEIAGGEVVKKQKPLNELGMKRLQKLIATVCLAHSKLEEQIAIEEYKTNCPEKMQQKVDLVQAELLACLAEMQLAETTNVLPLRCSHTTYCRSLLFLQLISFTQH